jgi:2-oxo-4-hydroxy-4-carboxy--5-ureidoimidazoline (OHCU) decarboxylase
VRHETRKGLREYLDTCHRATLRFAGKRETLVSALRSGDESARRDVLRVHRELAVLLAIHMKPARMTPEDAAQEGLLALERVIDSGSARIPQDLASEIDHVLSSETP